MAFDFMDVLGAATDVGTSVFNMFQGERQFRYEKKLQQKIFDREDNAVRRRAADLEAAGLSKTLAAGSAAGAGSAVRASTPRMDKLGLSEKLAMARAAMLQKKQIENTQADIDRKKLEYKIRERDFKIINNEIAGQRSDLTGSTAEFMNLVNTSLGQVEKWLPKIGEIIAGAIGDLGFGSGFSSTTTPSDKTPRSGNNEDTKKVYKGNSGFYEGEKFVYPDGRVGVFHDKTGWVIINE